MFITLLAVRIPATIAKPVFFRKADGTGPRTRISHPLSTSFLSLPLPLFSTNG